MSQEFPTGQNAKKGVSSWADFIDCGDLNISYFMLFYKPINELPRIDLFFSLASGFKKIISKLAYKLEGGNEYLINMTSYYLKLKLRGKDLNW